MHDDDELTPEERDAFARLPRTETPPPGFEDRVVNELRGRGEIGAPRGGQRWLWQLAAALVLVASGFVAGRGLPAAEAPTPPSPAGTRQYLLLLYGGATATPEVERERVIEYGNWARAESASGKMIMGERLGDGVAWLGNEFAGPPLGKEASGFFLIRARSNGEAAEIASRCPHLRHGGGVSVRIIE